MTPPRLENIEGESYLIAGPIERSGRFMSTYFGTRFSDRQKVVIKRPVSRVAALALRDSVNARSMSANETDGEGCLMEHGLLHRDIKPVNTLVDGRLIDIDLLVPADGREGAESFYTPLGSRIYMPPEIYRGKGGRPWSDFYSLGMTALLMMGDDRAQRLLKTLKGDDLIWLRSARFEVLRKEKELEAAVQKLSEEARSDALKVLRFARAALKDDPDRRPKTAGEYLQILEDGGNVGEV